jgi:hypothetical protein
MLRRSIVLRCIAVAALAALSLAPLTGLEATDGSPLESYRYRERTGQDVRHYRWRLDRGETVRITSTTESGRVFTAWCRSDGTTVRWEVADGPDRLTVERRDRSLQFRGRLGGRTVERSISIDERPWYQPLSFSLRGVAGGDGSPEAFWTIRPDDLSVLSMTASTQAKETVTVDGHRVDAVRVEVRPAGWRSAFWSCHYWFRIPDRVFIRYRGVHGVPGSPETVVELVPAG